MFLFVPTLLLLLCPSPFYLNIHTCQYICRCALPNDWRGSSTLAAHAWNVRAGATFSTPFRGREENRTEIEEEYLIVASYSRVDVRLFRCESTHALILLFLFFSSSLFFSFPLGVGGGSVYGGWNGAEIILFYPCYRERPVIFSLFFSSFFPFISHSCRFCVPTSRPHSFFRSGLHPASSTGRRRMDTQIRCCCCCCPFFLLDFLSQTRISKENMKTARERGRNPEMDFMSMTFGWRHTTREREKIFSPLEELLFSRWHTSAFVSHLSNR